MKKIWTDFNEPDPSRFRLIEEDIKFFKLQVGERIIFYTEDIQLEAIVEFDDIEKRWYGKIVSDCIEMPNEIVEARDDGFFNGHLFGAITFRNEIKRRMEEKKLPKDIVDNLTKIEDAFFEAFGYKKNNYR
jgi:hypothetical protein